MAQVPYVPSDSQRFPSWVRWRDSRNNQKVANFDQRQRL